MIGLDETDVQILNILQNDARIPNVEIARQIGMAPSGVLERVRKLEERGVILGYEARINPAAIDVRLTAYCQVRTCLTDAHEQSAALAAFPEVQEVHDVAGDDCFLLKLRLRDTDALSRFLREQIAGLPGVISTRTTIVIGTEKETARLPIPAAKKKEKAQ